MKDFILEFATPGTKITKKYGHLKISQKNQETEIPLDDISGVIILGTDLLISTAAIYALLNKNVSIQFTTEKFLPIATLASTTNHHHSRFRQLAQQNLSEIQVNRLWQKIVVQKIANQAKLLDYLAKDSQLLWKLSQEVESGDASNKEAQAARVYWKNLFGPDFTRNPMGSHPNSFLNYGYAIIRSAIARSVVATGLHPHMGIFHRNMENPLCLVDDLMEPFRPVVDYLTHSLLDEKQLNKSAKQALAASLQIACEFRGERKDLLSGIQQFVFSFCNAVINQNYKLFDTDLRFIFTKRGTR